MGTPAAPGSGHHGSRSAPTAAAPGGWGAASLPLPRTPLIGREQELAELAALVQDETVPLVTVTGPGGVGKTRLALQVTANVAASFADGVAVVPLADLRDPRLLLPTLVRALALDATDAGSAHDRLLAHLGSRRFLLVLDNLEQIADAASDLGALLARCPGLTILDTSRVVLRVSGEHVLPVQPLPVPEAVQLFVTRARAADAAFGITAANAATIAAICRRLDGLPLAIELAVARLRSLPPAALLTHLDQALPLLTDGARDQPDRLRTMRAAIAWSYDLLDPNEQRLFRGLSAFVGGFDLRGAAAVAGAGEQPGVAASDTGPAVGLLNGITSLIEKSLLRPAPGPGGDEPRYRMLETVREFGTEQLREAGEEEVVFGALAAYILSLVRHVHDQRMAPGAAALNARLDIEYDNVRSVLSWAVQRGDAELGLALGCALRPFWMIRGYFQEGFGWLSQILAVAGPEPLALRGEAMTLIGWLAYLLGDFPGARAWLMLALAAVREAGKPYMEASTLLSLALVDSQLGDLDAAARWSDASIALAVVVETTPPGGPQFTSITRANRGQIALLQGDLEQAATRIEQARITQHALGFAWALGDTLRIAGDLAVRQGDHGLALSRYRESLDQAKLHEDTRHLAETLVAIGILATECGEPARAARYFSAASALRGSSGATMSSWTQPSYERAAAAVHAQLSPEAFAANWAVGEGWSLDEVIIDARSIEVGFSAGRESSAPAAAATFNLTPREAEVLRLLATGLSDREIGEALFVGTRTVNYHVANLLAKLELDSRVAAAAFAVRHGLG